MRLEGPKRVEGVYKQEHEDLDIHIGAREASASISHHPQLYQLPSPRSGSAKSEEGSQHTGSHDVHIDDRFDRRAAPPPTSPRAQTPKRYSSRGARCMRGCMRARCQVRSQKSSHDARQREAHDAAPRDVSRGTAPRSRHADSREPTATHQHTPDKHTPTPTLGDQGGRRAHRSCP